MYNSDFDGYIEIVNFSIYHFLKILLIIDCLDLKMLPLIGSSEPK